jgi:phosphoribosyl 1,2-cyclic phosphodiesterase
MRVKLWGTRGLVPSPRQETAVFGGNTSCVQILHENHLIIIDTGFGCTNLGDELAQRAVQGDSLSVHVFYTHFHWDHIQGLPFFKPIYFPTTTLNLYSPEPTQRLLDNLDILFDGSYSPFESLLRMPAAVRLHHLTAPLTLGGLSIAFQPVDHGAALEKGHECYAYRLTAPDGASVALVTDHEARATARNREVCAFAAGCDLLIHDAQETDAEARRGWGHSTARQALDNAVRCNAGMTLLTHHAPSTDDRDIHATHRELLRSRKYRHVDFEFAREDVVYEVARRDRLPKAG